MASPLSRLRLLMGGEQAFNNAQATAGTTTESDTTTRYQGDEDSGPASTNYESIMDFGDHGLHVDSPQFEALLCSDQRRGKLAPQVISFASFYSVKYLATELEKLMNPGHHPASLKAEWKFWSRQWTIYYISSRFIARPLLLIPIEEAKQFLDEICSFKASESQGRDEQLISILDVGISFPDAQLPRPRYLCRVKNRTSFNIFEDALLKGKGSLNPDENKDEKKLVDNAESCNNPDIRTALSYFRRNLLKMSNPSVEDLTEDKVNALKALYGTFSQAIGGFELTGQVTDWKKRRQLIKQSQSNSDQERWCSALKRSQRYLGLLTAQKIVDFETEHDAISSNYSMETKHDFHSDVIFVCVDVEADEQNTDVVTEIGIALLDTRDIQGNSAGLNGSNWYDMIRGKHFRIAERVHVKNHLYVEGNPENFNPEFGQSEFVPLHKLTSKIRECFEIKDETGLIDTPLTDRPLRNIVLVGHSIKGDIRWLEKVGFNLITVTNLLEVLTTEELQKALKHDKRGGTSLYNLLCEMGIQPRNLHNAGNDAVYTLQAFVSIAFKAISPHRPVDTLEERITKAQALAKEQAEREWASWEIAEEKSGDGDAPVPYRSSTFRR